MEKHSQKTSALQNSQNSEEKKIEMVLEKKWARET